MNIFVTDYDPIKAAQSLPDKLIVKMPLETAQIMSTVFRKMFPDKDAGNLYRKTHENHPVVKWAESNMYWTYLHGKALCEEYTNRYGKVHACSAIIDEAWNKLSPHVELSQPQKFVQCMPEKYRGSDTVSAYRSYMINEKQYARWNHSQKPDWWIPSPV